MKLLAIPLFELYDNAARYGPQLSAIPHLLSRSVRFSSSRTDSLSGINRGLIGPFLAGTTLFISKLSSVPFAAPRAAKINTSTGTFKYHLPPSDLYRHGPALALHMSMTRCAVLAQSPPGSVDGRLLTPCILVASNL